MTYQIKGEPFYEHPDDEQPSDEATNNSSYDSSSEPNLQPIPIETKSRLENIIGWVKSHPKTSIATITIGAYIAYNMCK